jgi:hypothetical protein
MPWCDKEPERYFDDEFHDGIESSEFLYRFTPEDSESVARKIASYILARLRVLMTSRTSLERLADDFGVKLIWDNSLLDHGGYVGPFHETDTAQMMLQPGLAKPSRWRVFIHELAHHLMRVWVALDLYRAECVVVSGITDPASIRQEIARRVEALLVPALLGVPHPSGLTPVRAS